MDTFSKGSLSRFLIFHDETELVDCSSSLLMALNCIRHFNPQQALQILWSQSPVREDELFDIIWLEAQCLQSLGSKAPFLESVQFLSNQCEETDWRLQQILLLPLNHSNSLRPSFTIIEQLLESSGARNFPHLTIAAISNWLRAGEIQLADQWLQALGPTSSLDYVFLQAKILEVKGDLERAESLLFDNLSVGIHNVEFCTLLVEILFRLQRSSKCLPVLREAIIHHGNTSFFLRRLAEAKLLQYQPGPALRFKLLERLQESVGAPQQIPTALSTAYDMLGRTDWFAFWHPALMDRPGMAPDLSSNLMLHCSSHALTSYPGLAQRLTQYFEEQWQSLGISPTDVARPQTNKSVLKIAWICGDICNHPVFRFLYSWLSASLGLRKHEHWVVASHRPLNEYAQLVHDLPDVHLLDVSNARNLPEFVSRIREQNYDIAIDLNGWTANNIAPAFLARLAPLQINYLAYHASSGMNQMDTWLIDDNLIPCDSINIEWHTEELHRLPCPFLAWQPSDLLPEGSLHEVAPLSFNNSEPIRFGCFNHPRKISSYALSFWAELLNSVPNSALVLKAFSSEDSDSATLLKRRLIRAGLNYDRIHFLPFTSTPQEHLLQYGQMDIALDSFPNTGCTTTCEALWMGVPVITLRGQHYVSRMAHSVLCAAGLSDWSFEDRDDFIAMCLRQAQPERLQWLRANRGYWRQQVQESPLGDAKNLMANL